MKLYRTWKERIAIVNTAYSVPKNIRPTAERWDVSPSQIRRWNRRLAIILNQKSSTERQHIMNLHTTQKGRPRINDELYAALKLYYENTRRSDRVVSVKMLVYELQRLLIESGQGEEDIKFSALRSRVYRWCYRNRIVQRRITHVAQNSTYDPQKVADFVSYINSEISAHFHSPANIVNIDETNIYFDMVGSSTLETMGRRTISIKSSGSSNRCTALLGVTMDGTKLPPFIIFKGKETGRVIKEFTSEKHDYATSVFYTVQEKAWVDTRIFLEWVEKVWKPFTKGKEEGTYLLMDEFSVPFLAL